MCANFEIHVANMNVLRVQLERTACIIDVKAAIILNLLYAQYYILSICYQGCLSEIIRF